MTSNSTVGRPRPPLDDPRLLPFLPMLYVAWADGDLSHEESLEICDRLGEPCRSLLGPWLDPEQPPTASELQRLLNRVRSTAVGLETREKKGLASLGLELARVGDLQVSEEERQALVDLGEVLGVASTEAVRQLLASRRPAEPTQLPFPSFSVDALRRRLEGEHAALRHQVLSILDDPRLRRPSPADHSVYREEVLAGCRLLADEGFGSLSFPTEHGGGGDIEAFIVAFETLAFGDLSLLVKFGVQFGLFGGSILNLGTERHHAKYLRDIGTLALPGCFAMTETGHGSNVQDLETVARFDPERDVFVIHTPHPGARKDYIGNAASHGRLATVFAQLDLGEEQHGVHAFLVPIRSEDGTPLPGITIEDDGEKMGLNGVDNGRLGFDHVAIPRDHLLDRFASVDADGTYHSPIASPTRRFFTMLGTLVGGRVSVALAALAATKSALTIAVRYGSQRRQFGPADEPEIRVLDYLAHQRRLLPRLATTYGLHFALSDLRRLYAAGDEEQRQEVEARAAGLKAISTWHATDTIQTCRECCGGQGYLAENRFADLKADTDVFTTFEGDNVVLLQLVAKGLLSGYKRQFGQMTFFSLVRYIARQAGRTVSDLNPIITRRHDEAHLRDREMHRAAFEWRESHLLASVARRLKKRIDRGLEVQVALNECQDHLLETARAHVDRLVLESFTAAVDREEDEGVGAVLDKLCQLYALERLETHRGWYQEQGYFEAPKSRAVVKLVNRLCAELRPDAVPLVSSFGIPQELLAAPIAR